MVGESEVIVGAEVEDRFTVGADLGLLGRGDDSFGFVGAGFLHGMQFFGYQLF